MLNTWIYPKRYTHVSIGVRWHIFNYVGEAPLTRVHYITNPNNALFYRIPPPKKPTFALFIYTKKTVFHFMIPAYCTNCFASAKHPRQKRTLAPPWPRVCTSWDDLQRLVAEMGQQIWGGKQFTRGTFKTLMWHCGAFHCTSWLIRILTKKIIRALVTVHIVLFSIQCGWFWKIPP